MGTQRGEAGSFDKDSLKWPQLPEASAATSATSEIWRARTTATTWRRRRRSGCGCHSFLIATNSLLLFLLLLIFKVPEVSGESRPQFESNPVNFMDQQQQQQQQQTANLPHHSLYDNNPLKNDGLAASNLGDDLTVRSFSASSYPHYVRRKYTYDDLRQLYRSVGCIDDEILVHCKADANSTVVIENATFYAVHTEEWLNCSQGPVGPLAMGGLGLGINPDSNGRAGHQLGQRNIFAGVSGFSTINNNVRDLRQALNRRCSGMSKKKDCTFNLQLDHPESIPWGQGIVDIYFRCVPNTITTKSCNSEISVSSNENGLQSSSQFLMSPVYPKYYVGGRKCKWTLRADPGQRIQLRFLDISLREQSSRSEPECTDSIRVTERGRTLLSMCGESTQDLMILSESNKLEVRLDTQSRGIFSTRGILAEFWPLGCATPREPGYGYLHVRNDTHATFSCSVGYVFQDSLDRSRTVACDPERGQWSASVVNCVSLDYLRRYGNSTIQALLASKGDAYYSSGGQEGGSSQKITIVPPLNSSLFSDIVIPTVIVSVVVVVSLFAIIVLLLIRRHIALEGQEALGHYDDRNALTPASIRRLSPPHPPLNNGGGHHVHHHHHQQHHQGHSTFRSGPPQASGTTTTSTHQPQVLPQPLEPLQQQHPGPGQPQQPHNNGGLVMHIDLDRQREELFLC